MRKRNKNIYTCTCICVCFCQKKKFARNINQKPVIIVTLTSMRTRNRMEGYRWKGDISEFNF